MTKTRILIVDDQPDVRMALQMSVKKMNAQYAVSVASDGFEALDLLREEPFDLVITDYMMPGMDGLELIESIRALSPNTQLIATSALQSKTLGKLLDEARVSYFLPKPFSRDDVHQLVQEALAETARIERAAAPAPAPSRTPADSKVSACLNELRHNTGAHSCLVVESLGYIIAAEGGDEKMPLDSLASLIAANAEATTEVSRLMGNPEPFQSSIHEGKRFNVASYILEAGQIVVVVFGKQVKIGMVQHYARQIAPALSAALPSRSSTFNEDAFFNDDFMTSIDNSLDGLFMPAGDNNGRG